MKQGKILDSYRKSATRVSDPKSQKVEVNINIIGIK